MNTVIIEQDQLLLTGGFEGIAIEDIAAPVVLEAESVTEDGADEVPARLTLGEGWSEVTLDAQSVEIVDPGPAGPVREDQTFLFRLASVRITAVRDGETHTFTARNASLSISGTVVGAREASEGETGTEKELEPAEPQPESPQPDKTPEASDAGQNTQETAEIGTGVETQVPDNTGVTETPRSHTGQILFGIALAAAVLAAGFYLWQRRRRGAMAVQETAKNAGEAAPRDPADRGVTTRLRAAPELMVGKLHHIGKRSSQQDSLGLVNVPGGILAIVADGMGGLSDGDKVSQKIVYTMLNDAGNHSASQLSGNLMQLVSHANSEVNQMLGNTGQYVSGSTLVAALAEPGCFRYVSVGDSRIYLYRGGGLLQLNREHVYEAELLERAVNREMSFQEARTNAKRKSVTSFIGMGELKHIDEPLNPVKTQRGDKLLLTSDGLFNTLSDDEIAAILAANSDPGEAASALEAAVLAKNNPHQDNFSSILICYQ